MLAARVVTAINGATSASNVFTELKPINARVCQLLTAWLAQPQRGATYRFASGRENEAPLLQSKDAECLIEVTIYLLLRSAKKILIDPLISIAGDEFLYTKTSWE